MKISVIIPVYNTKRYLSKCLYSILNQTLKDIEVIVVDDGSTDKPEEVIKDYQKKFRDRLIFFKKENGGQGSARNLGIKKATGDYIGFVDSDDYVDLSMYEEMYNQAIKNDSDIVICGIKDYYEINGETKDYTIDLKKSSTINEALIKSVPSVVNKIYKKELIKKNSLEFNENIWYEDLPYSLEMIANANKISFINKPFYTYFHRSKSTMHNENIKKNLDILKAYDELVCTLKKENLYETYKEEFNFILLKEIYISTINRIIRTNNKRKEKLKVIKEIKKYCASFKVKKTKYFNTLSKAQKISYYLIKLRLYFVISLLFKVKGRNK